MVLQKNPPSGIEPMLRIHLLKQCFELLNVAMADALFSALLDRQFAGLSGMSWLPDRVIILRFRHLLEKRELAVHCVVENALLRR